MTETRADPVFPPLLTGLAVAPGADPFETAIQTAQSGCDGGLILYAPDAADLQMAIVLAPEVTLSKAAVMLPLCALGFHNALGALAPPEVAVQLTWAGGIRINDAECGKLRIAAPTADPVAVPDWLVIGVQVPLWPQSDNPGDTPDQTSLYAEGCGDVDPVELLEFWARHTLVLINHWAEDGTRTLHRDWSELAYAMGQEMTIVGQSGTFLGLDEDFGLLLKSGDTTTVIPLTTLLETPA